MDDHFPLIQLQNLSKVFYTDEVETHALDGVNLAIHPGEYVAISGPSGCGKSTLLSILGLLDSPTAGEYTLNGCPVAQLRPGRPGADPQPGDRLHLPELQLDQGADPDLAPGLSAGVTAAGRPAASPRIGSDYRLPNARIAQAVRSPIRRSNGRLRCLM